jgi:hypothetical protein
MSILSAKHVITINHFHLIFGEAGAFRGLRLCCKLIILRYSSRSMFIESDYTNPLFAFSLYVQIINRNILSVTACIFGNTQLV